MRDLRLALTLMFIALGAVVEALAIPLIILVPFLAAVLSYASR